MFLDSPTQRDLLADLGTRRAGELQPRSIRLDGDDLCARGRGADVDHEDFVLGQLCDFGLLAVGGLDAEQAAEEEVVDFELGVDRGKLAAETEDETDETVCTAECWVDSGADTCGQY